MPLMIADSGLEFQVMFREEFITLTHATTDHIFWIVRAAIKELPVSYWEANEDVARRNRLKEEGLDCFCVPFGEIGHVYMVEVVPYPKGYLLITLRGVDDIQPTLSHPKTVIFPSSILKHAPVKTVKEMHLTQAAIDIEALRHDFNPNSR